MIQVVKEHVVPCPQCIEKRCGLAAENSDDLFLVKKTENSIAEFRAGAFQIAEFVDYRPLGSGLNGAGYRSDAEPKEAIHSRCHLVAGSLSIRMRRISSTSFLYKTICREIWNSEGLRWMVGSDSRSFTSKIICQFHTVARKRLRCKSWKWS